MRRCGEWLNRTQQTAWPAAPSTGFCRAVGHRRPRRSRRKPNRDLLDGARATDHCWPVLQDGSKPRVLLVCRADMRGLTAAQSALTQWASGAAPEVDLLGLAVLADAPGKTPKALRDFAAIVGGGAPRLWTLPWVEAWRHGDSTTAPPAREYQRLITDLAALATDTTPQHHPLKGLTMNSISALAASVIPNPTPVVPPQAAACSPS